MKTPVAFLIFNRPDTTKKVFDVIRQAKPSKLLVVADGPRVDRPGEAGKCTAARAVIDRVDWDCEVLTNYSEINLGCKKRISSGLKWVFETVEEATILEDDCLPHITFFRFCEELLQKYRDDKRIMMISGTNLLRKWKSDSQSYHFSYYGGIWGWASWKRAWNYYDSEMNLWKFEEVRNRIKDVLVDDYQYKIREKLFENAYLNNIDAWSYQWSFARLAQSGLTIVPSVNLISNIGFNEDATHTKSSISKLVNIETEAIRFPLQFNSFTAVDRDYDRQFFNMNTKEKLFIKLKNKTSSLLGSLSSKIK